MKIETTPNVNWNKAPFNMDNTISKEVRNALCKRFDVAIATVRDTDKYSNLKLEDGWVVKSKTDVVFILNANKNEDIPNNAEVNGEFDSGAIGLKLRKARDKAFDLEKYSELSQKVEGIKLDPTTGKITYKVI